MAVTSTVAQRDSLLPNARQCTKSCSRRFAVVRHDRTLACSTAAPPV